MMTTLEDLLDQRLLKEHHPSSREIRSLFEEVRELIETVTDFEKQIRKWLSKNHPDLL